MRTSKTTKIATCLLASACLLTPLNLVAAPKWKKVNVSTGSSGGGNGTISNLFNCVSIIDSTKDIPAAAAAALTGVQVNYSMVGGAGGSSVNALGSSGTVVAGSFTVSNQRYQFYVGGGGGGNVASGHCAGGGGSSAIVAGATAIAVAKGGDGGNNVGSGGGTSAGGSACTLNTSYTGGGGMGYYGGGGSTAGGLLSAGPCGVTGNSGPQAGGDFGSGGNGNSTGNNCVRPGISQDGSGSFNGRGSTNWLNQSLPSLPAMAGRANGAYYGGNAGAIILSYTATSCLF